MVGNDAMAGAMLTIGHDPGQTFGSCNEIAEGVGIVIVMHPLHHCGDPFQPHAGIDRGFGQRRAIAIGILVKLHEDQVPYLDKAVTIFVRRTGRATGNVLAMIVEDFAARTARPGIAHGPEIVARRDADDPLIGQAGNLAPQIKRLVIGVIDSGGQLVGRKSPFLRQKSPCMANRLFLEVISEGKITQHLEECVMPCGIADIIEIVVFAPGADTFLRAGRARRRWCFKAGKDILERHHPGIDEHQCRVVIGHQRRALHGCVVCAREIIEEGAANIVGRLHAAQLSTVRASDKRLSA